MTIPDSPESFGGLGTGLNIARNLAGQKKIFRKLVIAN